MIELEKMGFNNFAGNLWSHDRLGTIHVEEEDSLEDVAYKIYCAGYRECQNDFKKY